MIQLTRLQDITIYLKFCVKKLYAFYYLGNDCNFADQTVQIHSLINISLILVSLKMGFPDRVTICIPML